MLLYTVGNFFQILEGEAPPVDALYYEKICRDTRHEQCTQIIREPIVRRSFANWSMGFSHVSPAELKGIPGCNDFFQESSCFTQLDAGRAKKLLAAFARGSWRARSATAGA
jgi:hypothetical protein